MTIVSTGCWVGTRTTIVVGVRVSERRLSKFTHHLEVFVTQDTPSSGRTLSIISASSVFSDKYAMFFIKKLLVLFVLSLSIIENLVFPVEASYSHVVEYRYEFQVSVSLNIYMPFSALSYTRVAIIFGTVSSLRTTSRIDTPSLRLSGVTPVPSMSVREVGLVASESTKGG